MARNEAPRWPPLVIDFTTAWAGPLCGAVLADLGWDVVKVETATRPDITRRLGPWADGVPGLERSGYFDSLNRGKRSIAIDLRQAEGRALAATLCAAADAVIENFSPGVMQRLGLDYATLSARNPALVMLSISGYGASGPERNYVAYGQTIEAVTGMDAATGYRAGEPAACGAPIADHVAGMTGAFAVLQAVERQRRTGEGAYLDLSMIEALLGMMPGHLIDYQVTGELPLPQANADAGIAPHGCYPCAGEDRWIALSASTAGEWRGLCTVLGLGDLLGDASLAETRARLARREDLDRRIGAATAGREVGALVEALREAGVPATVVANGSDLIADETLCARGFVQEVETTEAGPRILAGRLASFSFLQEPIERGGPKLGEHTADVLGGVLGIAPAEVERLRAAGVLN